MKVKKILFKNSQVIYLWCTPAGSSGGNPGWIRAERHSGVIYSAIVEVLSEFMCYPKDVTSHRINKRLKDFSGFKLGF